MSTGSCRRSRMSIRSTMGAALLNEADEGITDTLAQEVTQFGVRVTAVAPGAFKTDWAGRSLVRAPCSIADYDALFDPIRTPGHRAEPHCRVKRSRELGSRQMDFFG
jgi:NAD(P)-dependent dehydrogenase (short-subunit alcohol dehydrogenase family)